MLYMGGGGVEGDGVGGGWRGRGGGGEPGNEARLCNGILRYIWLLSIFSAEDQLVMG